MYCPSKFFRGQGGSFVWVHLIGKPGVGICVRVWIVACLASTLVTIARERSRVVVIGSFMSSAIMVLGWII
jgi:maltodextrin utilization protein YvdJ